MEVLFIFPLVYLSGHGILFHSQSVLSALSGAGGDSKASVSAALEREGGHLQGECCAGQVCLIMVYCCRGCVGGQFSAVRSL